MTAVRDLIILEVVKKVIIVNEDRDFCRTYKESFEKAGLEVEVCYDGKIGLAQVLSQRPGAVVLGIMLPTLNGFDVLRVLREKETTKDTPVFICSKLGGEEIKELKQLGATAFFPKAESTPQILLEEIKKVLA